MSFSHDMHIGHLKAHDVPACHCHCRSWPTHRDASRELFAVESIGTRRRYSHGREDDSSTYTFSDGVDAKMNEGAAQTARNHSYTQCIRASLLFTFPLKINQSLAIYDPVLALLPFADDVAVVAVAVRFRCDTHCGYGDFT